MSKGSKLEAIKKNSNYLRGTIREQLESDVSYFDEENFQLLKFHGTYQQDDRDLRVERRKAKMERAYIMMVRCKIPAGRVTADQYLILDENADRFGNGTLRITSRQGIQFHNVLKDDLKSCIREINESGLTTLGACGDVMRNVVATPNPLRTPAHDDIPVLANDLVDAFSPKTSAYTEIWLDGEKVELGPDEEVEPVYKDCYMPRKYKIGIGVPPRNDVDVLSHDVGLVPHVENGTLEGYSVFVGGGFGMSHNKQETYPRLARPLFFVPRPDLMDAMHAILSIQRDYGNRENRKRARMKYLVDERGIDWMRQQTLERMKQGVKTSEVKPIKWETVHDMLGWHEQGDGQLFRGIWIPDGRIKDEEEVQYRSGLREVTKRFGFPIRLTPNCNFIIHDIDPSMKDEVDDILSKHNIPKPETLTEARKTSMACVSLPTCGLGLAESERVFSGVMDKVDDILHELGLDKDQILIRMTGCPNGCARPYNADLAFVGKSPGKYVFYVGGSHTGERMAAMEKKVVNIDDIPSLVRSYLETYVENRLERESFTDYWGRTKLNGNGEAQPEQFHKEPSERQ